MSDDSILTCEISDDDSEHSLHVLRSTKTIQTYKPNFRKKANRTGEGSNMRPVKRLKLDDSQASTSKSHQAPDSSDDDSGDEPRNPPIQSRVLECIIVSDSDDDEQESSSVEEPRQCERECPEMQAIRRLTYAASREFFARSRLSALHQNLWLRQQRDLETRRRNLLQPSRNRSPPSRPIAQHHDIILQANLPIALQSNLVPNPTRHAGIIIQNSSRPSITPQYFISLMNFHTRRLWNLHAHLEQYIEDNDGATAEVIHNNSVTFDYDVSHQTNSQRSCVICISPFELGQRMRRLPCVHVFHKNCVDAWLHHSRRCPICRNEIAEDSPDTLEDVLEVQDS